MWRSAVCLAGIALTQSYDYTFGKRFPGLED